MRRQRRRVHLYSNEKGSFTLEAAYVFPLVMICTLALLFLGMYVYQKIYLQHIAELAAERSAHVWDNSRKQVQSGHVHPAEHDGLYWRLTQDSISDLFGMLVSNPPTTIALPVNEMNTGSYNQPEKKLARAAVFLPPGLSGHMSYTNHGYERKITIALKQPWRVPSFFGSSVGSETLSVQASSRVVEPVELIRLVDLTRSYIGVIKEKISPKAAKAVLREPAGRSQQAQGVAFKLESQAAAYLQQLVNGSVQTLKTPSGKSRKIDALDRHGIAHQAFITFTEHQLLAEQIPKDSDLLHAGKDVKGVVWHFFRREGRPGPVLSNKLRKELERKGIVYIIHE